jgi:RimJ/RimL family protein N-acetyltransferase
MDTTAFVPSDFVVPSSLETPLFRLEPLGPQHNEADYAAWTSSIEHIRRTPGYPDGNWPDGRPIADNLRDLRRHADDFEHQRGFTYTVLDRATADVIGCVYIYPDPDGPHRARVQSWVRASRAELDVPLWRAVSTWLEASWPFEAVTYGDRQPD